MRPRQLVLALGGVAFVLVSLATASTGHTSGDQPLPRADKVVVFAIPRLGLRDVSPKSMPTLARLADRGAIASLRVKTVGSVPNSTEAYASLGAGEPLGTGSSGTASYDSGEMTQGLTALRGQQLRTGSALHGAVVVPAMPTMVSSTGGSGSVAGAGTLGSLLHDAGHRTAVVGNADTVPLSGEPNRVAQAAVAIADRDGMVDAGTVSPDLNGRNRRAPFGLSVDTGRFVSAVTGALGKADVVVADPGETTRAANYLTSQTPSQGARARTAALTRTDRVLAALDRRLPPRTLLLVVGLTPAGGQWALTPLVASGQGVGPGRLVSPSTHHAGLATLSDLAPTILSVLGAPESQALRGTALRLVPGSTSWAPLRSLDDLLASRATTNLSMTTAFIVLQALLYVVAMAALWQMGSPSRFSRLLEVVALACAAWPLATFWIRLSAPASSLGMETILITWLLAVALALAAQRLRAHPLDPLLLICALTIATIAIDLATGAHLMMGSFFGYSPATGSRYIGIDNATFAILAGCTVVTCAAIVDRAGRREEAWWVAVMVAITAVVVDGAPWMGADVGGILTLVPVLSLTLWALAGRRVRFRAVAAACGAALLVLLVAVGVEALRAPDQRTHIGRFFLGAGSENGQLFTSTISRKWSMNMRIFGQTVWAWMVPIIAGFGVYVLVIAKGWQRLLPAGSPRRIAVVSGLAMGIVGWLLNDSGVVVTALVFVYLGPLLLLLALRVPDEPPTPETHPMPQLQEAP